MRAHMAEPARVYTEGEIRAVLSETLGDTPLPAIPRRTIERLRRLRETAKTVRTTLTQERRDEIEAKLRRIG